MIPKSRIKRIPTEQGESIEDMIRRCTENNEPIDTVAPMIYTEEKDGVQPQYDIRTDRFDLALEAIEKVQKSAIAESDNIPSDPTPAPAGEENNG